MGKFLTAKFPKAFIHEERDLVIFKNLVVNSYLLGTDPHDIVTVRVFIKFSYSNDKTFESKSVLDTLWKDGEKGKSLKEDKLSDDTEERSEKETDDHFTRHNYETIYKENE